MKSLNIYLSNISNKKHKHIRTIVNIIIIIYYNCCVIYNIWLLVSSFLLLLAQPIDYDTCSNHYHYLQPYYRRKYYNSTFFRYAAQICQGWILFKRWKVYRKYFALIKKFNGWNGVSNSSIFFPSAIRMEYRENGIRIKRQLIFNVKKTYYCILKKKGFECYHTPFKKY